MVNKINEFLKNNKYSKSIIIILFAVALTILYKDRHINKEMPEYKVSIITASSTLGEVPIYLSALGTVTPNYTANIQAQVTGTILKINFKDGQKVKKGDVLVEIDPIIYQAQVTQYEGQLARDQALLDNANTDLKRYKELWKENSISNQSLATQVSLVDQYKGTVKMDKGLLDNAKANLGFCKITAPFDGQMGILLLTAGNLVNSSSNIAVINTQTPISVLFSIPESELSEVSKEFNKNKSLIVEVHDHDNNNLISTGELIALDNQINTSTGTIQLKAEFKNTDYTLFPNQFVNVKLLVKKIQNAVIIPVSAIQYGPNGSFVYKIEDGRAKIQLISLGALSAGQAIVKSGLLKDQILATGGGDRLSDNALVDVSKIEASN
jgi:multidrug efflux system membrane fusion protein